MKQKTKAISEMATADELLAVVAEIRDRVKNLPDEEQEKYYQTDKKEDEQLGEVIEEKEEIPENGGEQEELKEELKEELPKEELKEEVKEEVQEMPKKAENPFKEEMIAILAEIRDLLRKEQPQEEEEQPKEDEELDKPLPTDEEEAYEDEDFFK